MKERELRNLIADVKTGRLSRRAFVQRMIAVGLTAPIAGMMLSQSGVAMAATEIPYKPTKAGGGGLLKLLYWQAITLLNPHFAIGTKDQEGSRIFYEPLAGWDGEGNLVPALAAEIPSKENDGLAEDGRSVIWKLKRGVKWHDGKPFTADDVVFTWEYARTPETAAVIDRQLQGHQGREGRRFHRSRHVRQADAVLGRCLCRHLRHDPPKAPVCGLHRRQVARRADQSEAGGHRPLHVRRFQAGRHGAGQAQSRLPRRQPAAFRHAGSQGRRRRGIGRARGAADRRI